MMYYKHIKVNIQKSTRFELKTDRSFTCLEMDERRKKLKVNFCRFLTDGDEDPEKYGDDLIFGECWTWKEPEEVECWSITLTPCSDLLSFKTKFWNCQDSLPVSLYETVTEFKNGPDNIFIVSCKTVDPDHRDEYVFSYIVPSKEIVYSV